MDDGKNKRIGIFEYDWSMYSFTKDLIIKLAETGYAVDVFYKDVELGREFVQISEFNPYNNIRLFDFTSQPTALQILERKFKKLINKLALFFSVQVYDPPADIIDMQIINKSREIIGASQYLCFIGVEKKGLIWAGMLAQIFMRPLVYHSLELYVEDHPDIYRFYNLRGAEKRYHQLSSATIIQDASRAEALLKSNEMSSAKIIYFPISVRGRIVEQKSDFLHKKYNLGVDKKILLYFGSICEERFSTELVKMADNLEDNLVLVMHGFGDHKHIDHLRSIANGKKVVFSLDFVPEDEIVELISSTHIGIALYQTTNSNERLTAFSSVKMAYYMQCGVPFISFNTESYKILMSSYKCGALINSLNEIPSKTREILKNYDNYKRQAHLAFTQYYDFDKNVSEVIQQLDKLAPHD